MSPDPASLVGRTYGPGEFTVAPWLAHLWADATRNEDEVFHRPDAGGDRFAPPTLAQVVAREAAGTGDVEASLRDRDRTDLSVFLGGQRFEFERPLRVGGTYRATAEVFEVTRKEGRTGPFSVVTLTYDVATDAGTPAFEMETDLVVREDGDRPRRRGGATSDGGLEPGAEVARRVVADVDPADMRVVTAIVRDPNPLHYDRAYATDRGFEGRVNQGPVNAAYAAQAALELADSPADLREIDVRYGGFVVEGDTVTATATVDEVGDVDGEQVVDLDLELTTDDGERVLTGSATVRTDGSPQ